MCFYSRSLCWPLRFFVVDFWCVLCVEEPGVRVCVGSKFSSVEAPLLGSKLFGPCYSNWPGERVCELRIEYA